MKTRMFLLSFATGLLLLSADALAQEEKPSYDVFSFEQQFTLPGSPAIVESVWHHFVFEQFRPYIEKKHAAGH